jgi:hypothetical protein
MVKSEKDIILTIDSYMQKFQYRNSDWYVGVATDPRDRLFNGHNVDEHNGIWIFEEASSDSVARSVEKAYLNTGHDGGSGGGDENSVYVYAYVKLRGTKR